MTLVLRRQLLATALAVILVLLLLVLASLDGLFQAEPPEQITLRPIQMYVPPPPPPPPPVLQGKASSNAGSPLALVNQPELLELDTMDLEVSLRAGELGALGSGLDGVAGGTGIDWGTVNLSELDGYPQVLSAPVMAFPQELIDRNITQIEVVLHILIDETGKVFPVRVVKNDYPQMSNKELEIFASQVRFSPPLRLGVPVRTEYLWPIAFRALGNP